ncbi:hypothetical protein AWE51_19250 [Aquimarina aggregata]|uniref:HTH araC/xylS-type domain-containing protein n=1 Tax=Aquimarina aggregata TaxID=1642818 RepID=A0A162WLF2_9FLAO|nr:helix-turn-helix domain-containing protein [Aquimarina aggregata]KZS38177.1 hypothetical protein AWE51_19250 [Aquimarina aggregata]
MQLKQYHKFIFFLFFISLTGYGQSFVAPDSLKSKTYDELVDQFYSNLTDSSIAVIQANKYLELAKKDADTMKIMNGYYFHSVLNSSDLSLKYSDSIINILDNERYHSKDYPSLVYLSKAIFYYDKGNFTKALDNFFELQKESEKYQNFYLLSTSKNGIGILKSRLGKNKMALRILKESYNFFLKEKENYPSEYLETIFALSDSYRRNKLLDSASIMNQYGFKESFNLKEANMAVYFTLNEGVTQYQLGEYSVAKDSLKKSMDQLYENNDLANLSIAHYYLGKTLTSLNFKSKGIKEFIKADSIVQKISEVMPETRDGYEILINHFKENDDKNNQLKYLERLILIDSTINNNYKDLSEKINKEFDTPQLLQEKQKVITALEAENKSIYSKNIIISLLLGLSLFGVIYYNYRQRLFKKRFIQLRDKTAKKDDASKQSSGSTLNKETVNNLLDQLQKFEENKGFLKATLNAKDLAKSFGSNSSYLSKVINTFKEKTFSTYINDLRIDFVIDRLQKDRMFRKYTIKAIAQEIGFNNAEAFSKAFYKNTGIYPSYFIKELEK